MTAPYSFWLSGRETVKRILKTRLEYSPHDDQLRCVCRLLDKSDVLAILPTNAGKTGLFFMFVLVIIAIHANPEAWPRDVAQRFPPNPVMVVVVPTVGLAEEMEDKLAEQDIKAVAITEELVSAARLSGARDPWQRAQTEASIILLGPEMLTSPEFDKLLGLEVFIKRVVGLGVDEVHLIVYWGRDFRKSFQEIGRMRARFPSGLPLVATTGTLLAGDHTAYVKSNLGLHASNLYELRRSNIRHDIQVQFQTSTHGLGGTNFYDLLPILASGRKTIVFCSSIRQAFLALVYMWHHSPPFPERDKRFQLYNAPNTSDHNVNIRKLMADNPDCQIIFATDALHVGASILSILDVVVLSIVRLTADKFYQMIGRGGRDPAVKDSRGRLLLPKNAVEKAKQALAKANARGNGTGGAKIEDSEMDIPLARLILASCKIQEQNTLYANPTEIVACTCEGCLAHPPMQPPKKCTCSGCSPPPPLVPEPRVRRAAISKKERLNAGERALVSAPLYSFRLRLWESLDEDSMLPPDTFLTATTISTILDLFPLLKTVDDLAAHLKSPYLTADNRDELWSMLKGPEGLEETITARRAVAAPVCALIPAFSWLMCPPPPRIADAQQIAEYAEHRDVLRQEQDRAFNELWLVPSSRATRRAVAFTTEKTGDVEDGADEEIEAVEQNEEADATVREGGRPAQKTRRGGKAGTTARKARSSQTTPRTLHEPEYTFKFKVHQEKNAVEHRALPVPFIHHDNWLVLQPFANEDVDDFMERATFLCDTHTPHAPPTPPKHGTTKPSPRLKRRFEPENDVAYTDHELPTATSPRRKRTRHDP